MGTGEEKTTGSGALQRGQGLGKKIKDSLKRRGAVPEAAGSADSTRPNRLGRVAEKISDEMNGSR